MSDDYVKFYTGLPNITILKAVFDHVLPAVSLSDSSKLMPFQEYIAVLMNFASIAIIKILQISLVCLWLPYPELCENG